MSKELGPKGSPEEQAAGAKESAAWERFFSQKESAEQTSGSHPIGSDEQMRIGGILQAHEQEILRYPNVVGVAAGIGMKGGEPSGRLCIVVYVGKKLPRTELKAGELLPERIEGVRVDVVEVGEVRPLRA